MRAAGLTVIATLLIAGSAHAAAPPQAAVGRAVEPPYAVGKDAEGLAVADVRAPRQTRLFTIATFERTDIPVYEPGTIADCFAYGAGDLRSVDLYHFSMTCEPRNPARLHVHVAHYGRIDVARYRALRRRRARLPGTTLLAGTVGSGVRNVVVRVGGGRRLAVPVHRGAFLVAWRGWLESTRVTVRAEGADRWYDARIDRAEVEPTPSGPVVYPPYVMAWPRW